MTARNGFGAGLVALAVLVAGCTGHKRPPASVGGRPPAFATGSTMAAIQQRGKLVVATRQDQPGFGAKRADDGQVEGFDVDMARLVGIALFGAGGGDKVELVEAKASGRERLLQDGTVDLVVAMYGITDARRKVVGMAGPYFVARQDIAARTGDTSITDVASLDNRRVCGIQGTSSLVNLLKAAPQADTSTTFATYADCAIAVETGRVDALSTDQALLAPLVAGSGGALRLVGRPFTEEPYGIGVKLEATDLRDFVDGVLVEAEKDGSYQQAFDATLGAIGVPYVAPPKPDGG